MFLLFPAIVWLVHLLVCLDAVNSSPGKRRVMAVWITLATVTAMVVTYLMTGGHDLVATFHCTGGTPFRDPPGTYQCVQDDWRWREFVEWFMATGLTIIPATVAVALAWLHLPPPREQTPEG